MPCSTKATSSRTEPGESVTDGTLEVGLQLLVAPGDRIEKFQPFGTSGILIVGRARLLGDEIFPPARL